MQFTRPMLRGTLVRRYKRFLADVELDDGQTITVHCANSGSMKTCAEPGRPVILSDSENPKRKLRYTWEMIQMGKSWVGVHSALSNGIVADFVLAQKIPKLAGYGNLRREVKYGAEGRSRVDLLLTDHRTQPDCYVEIKHSTMRVDDFAAFPDAVTERGKKHLEDLSEMVRAGQRAVIFFVVGRADCRRFRPADEIDPAYGAALRHAVKVGVEAMAWRMRFSQKGVELLDELAVEL